MNRMIIVDDEPLVRQHLLHIIDWAQQGFEVVGLAQDGDEAFKLALDQSPDLIITDIRMPGIDGLQLIEQLKACKNAPVFIVLSGYGDFSYTQRAMQLGVRNYLLKPIEQPELMQALVRVRQELNQNRIQKRAMEKGILAQQRQWLLQSLQGINPQKMELIKQNQPAINQGYQLLLAEITVPEDEDNHFSLEDLSITLLGKQHIAVAVSAHHLLIYSMLALDTDAKRTAQNLQDELDMLGHHAYLVASQVLGDTRAIPKVYRQLEKILSARLLLGNTSPLMAQPALLTALDYPWQSILEMPQDALATVVSQGDPAAIQSQSEALLRLLEKVKYQPDFARGLLLSQLLPVIGLVEKAHGDTPQLMDGPFDMDQLLHALITQKSVSQLVSLLSRAATYLRLARNNRPTCISEKIIDLIHTKYKEDLTLTGLAQVFYMNPAYLGQLFKKETGQSLNAYLRNYRVTQAKRLLLNTNLTVTQIAYESGFQNLRSFYLAFGNQEGKTPKEYREETQQL